MSRKPDKAKPARRDDPPLNFHGLDALGYGDIPLSGNRLADQLSIEAMCFRIGHTPEFGGLGKFGHFKRIVDLLWNNPDLECHKRFVWNSWAEKILQEACECGDLTVAGCSSAGKCLEESTGILMFDGTIKPARDIRVGDLLMGDDSTARKVLEIHSGEGPLYQITPVRGEPWRCNGKHVLTLKRAHANKKCWRKIGGVVHISVEDYLQSSRSFRLKHFQYCAGVEFPEKPVWLDPRMLGLWVGDGHIHACRISIYDGEIEELEYVARWAENHGYNFSRPNNGSLTCPSYPLFPKESSGRKVNPLWNFLKGCIKEDGKRIPREYLVNSRAVRMNLLAGILDSDGYAGKTSFEVATKYEGLKDDILFLTRSLGFRSSAVLRLASCQGKKFPSWRITITGRVSEIPTLRKKAGDKTLRRNSDCTGFSVKEAGVGRWIGFSLDGNKRHLLADFTVTHNSDPLALYAVVSYIADPTHTLILQMSTTLAGAKKRIWKTTREYWEAIPELPGKALWGTNEVRGLNYRGDGYGLSSGIFLLASEQSAEAGTLDKLIGIKAPATGTPGRSFEELCADPEYADLVPRFAEAQLRDLLPRLTNLSEHRVGKLILIIDEATGCSPSVLNVIRTNLRPGNAGHFQSILIGNPNSHFDVMGDNATPVRGWSSVSVEDHEWETTSGGKLIRFNGEENPRITEPGGEKYSWMLRREDIEAMEKKYGRNSLFYYRMVLGMWFPAGVESGVYSEADFLHTGSMGHVTWGFKKPVVLAALDPAFTQGGDRASCTFGEYGLDSEGRTVLNRKEEIAIKFDPADTKLPASYQIVRNWKAECLRRGVSPRDAACDVTGSVPFADIIKVLWSSEVLMVNSGGNAPDTPIGEKDANNDAVKASARYANRSTYLWYGAMPFLRSGQVKGVTQDLARQICSRQHSKSNHGVGNKIKIESKRDYKMREKCSPDESDSFFLLVELAKVRRGWSPSERSGSAQTAPGKHVSSWKAFCDRARRLTRTPRLNSLRP